MPEYLSPGVYVEEISSGSKPIEGVSTSTAGFLGAAERGPENPQLITSFLEYQRWYGGYIPAVSYLTYAVQGFFDNGGKRCFVGRIVHVDPANPGSSATTARGSIGPFEVEAVGRGAWGDNIRIKIQNITGLQPGVVRFRVWVIYYTNFPQNFVDPTDPANISNPNRVNPDVTEFYDNLSAQPGATNNVITVINAASRLVRIRWTAATTAPPDQAFTAMPTQGQPGTDLQGSDFTGDLNAIGAAGIADDVFNEGRGLAAFENVDEISILCVPDEVRFPPAAVTANVVLQCERLKNRFAVVSAPQGQSNVANLRPPQDSTYAAFYYPWIWVYDPSVNDTVLVPPAGHVAGIYAGTDIARGVHKAPANVVVADAADLELPVPQGNQDMLNPRGVNCIRDFRHQGRGIRVWGARTMSSDPEWKYVNVRRLFIYVEQSIDQGTQWVVFEPNYDRDMGTRHACADELPRPRLAERRPLRHDRGRGVLRQVRPHDHDPGRHR